MDIRGQGHYVLGVEDEIDFFFDTLRNLMGVGAITAYIYKEMQNHMQE